MVEFEAVTAQVPTDTLIAALIILVVLALVVGILARARRQANLETMREVREALDAEREGDPWAI